METQAYLDLFTQGLPNRFVFMQAERKVEEKDSNGAWFEDVNST